MSNPNNSNALPVAFLIAITTITSAYYFSKPLVTARPKYSGESLPVVPATEAIPARLWQDPLLAVTKHTDDCQTDVTGAQEAQIGSNQNFAQMLFSEALQIKGSALNNSSEVVINVLIIMMKGETYAETIEDRVRARYAVVNGLYAGGLVPVNSNRLGYFCHKFQLKRPLGGTSGKKIHTGAVPFQWFRPDGKRADARHSVVLWLNESFIEEWPDQNLRNLEKNVRKHINDHQQFLLNLEKFSHYLEEHKSCMKDIDRGDEEDCDCKKHEVAEDGRLSEILAQEQINGFALKNIYDWETIRIKNPDKVKSDYRLRSRGDLLLLHGCPADLDPQQHKENLERLDAVIKQNDGVQKTSIRVLPKFFVVGPTNSDMLLTLLGTQTEESSDIVQIYSPYATASPKQLLGAIASRKDGEPRRKFSDTQLLSIYEEQLLKKFKQGPKVDLYRTNVSDDKTLELIKSELQHRGFERGNKKHHIALVSELDTFYARSVRDTFLDLLDEKCEIRGKSHQVDCYSYLRGLDGKIPEQQDPNPQNREQSNQGNHTAKNRLPYLQIPDTHPPYGRSQLDYARRLGRKMQDHLENGQEYMAIGVVGSDVYDKLLVLQALRPLFPKAIFFTLDLDDLLLQPAELAWTRGLIVGAGYGLDSEEGFYSPYRDSYQVALQKTVEFVLGDVGTKPPMPEPKLFEIGWRGAESLPKVLENEEISSSEAQGRFDLSDIFTLGRTDSDIPPWLGLAIVLIYFTILLTILLSWLSFTHWFTSLATVAGILGLTLGVVCEARLSPEALSFVSGISGWPAILMRGYVVIAGGLLITSAVTRLRANQREVESELKTPDESSAKLRRIRLVDVLPYRWWPPEKVTSVREFWIDYRRLRAVAPTLIRLALAILLYVIFSWVIISLFGMPGDQNLRGSNIKIANGAFLSLATVVTFSIVFYVGDAINCADMFVKRLSNHCNQLDDAIVMDWRSTQWAVPVGVVSNLQRAYLQYNPIRLVALYTSEVSQLIYYPLAVLLLMYLARITWFDAWAWSPSFVIIFGLLVAYTFARAILLTANALSLRRQCISNLEQIIFAIGNDKTRETEKADVEDVLSRVKSVNSGAFAPIWRNPIVGSLLGPLGGAGGIAILEFMVVS